MCTCLCHIVLIHILYQHRLTKQIISQGVSIHGGVSLKTHQPAIISAVENGLGLDLEIGDRLKTVYRVEMNGCMYYCKEYQRVKKKETVTLFATSVKQSKSLLLLSVLYMFTANLLLC